MYVCFYEIESDNYVHGWHGTGPQDMFDKLGQCKDELQLEVELYIGVCVKKTSCQLLDYVIRHISFYALEICTSAI